MRVGFLLNHDAPHQVPHLVPYAFVLSVQRPDWDVRIMCSSRAEADFAVEIGRLYPGQSAVIERLHVPRWARAIDPVARRVAFVRKPAVQAANLARFAALDALVVPEMTSLSLRDHPAMKGVKLIFTGHGAGDGYNQTTGMFDPRIDLFDLALLPGPRIARELLAMGRFAKTPYALAGYPKFETAALSSETRLFQNDRPTVLYNPTQNAAATSWHKFGPEVLDFFLQSDSYNLIFAPHVLLFTRSLTKGAALPRKYRSTDTVRIDTGSRASVDMTYLAAADLYLGDLSSQIYEFIAKPRPAVFLNPFGVDRTGDPAFASWTFGPVVREAGDLGPALDRAFAEFDTYRPVQQAALEDQYVQSDMPASTRGATVIAELLETGTVGPQWR